MDFGKVVLGSAQFGSDYGISNKKGKIPIDEIKKILSLSKDNNILTIDTAYGYGESEKILGECGIKDFNIISKIPSIPDNILDIKKWIFQRVDETLNRLKIDFLSALLVHDSKQITGLRGEKICDSFTELKKEKKIMNHGVSVYNNIEIENILKIFTPDIIQVPLNLIDRRLLNSGWIKKLNSMGIDVYARSIFLQGLLLMDKSQRPLEFKKWSDLWSSWDNWNQTSNQSSLETCYNFINNISEIKRIIIGIDSFKQFEELLKTRKTYKYPHTVYSSDERLLNPLKWDYYKHLSKG